MEVSLTASCAICSLHAEHTIDLWLLPSRSDRIKTFLGGELYSIDVALILSKN